MSINIEEYLNRLVVFEEFESWGEFEDGGKWVYSAKDGMYSRYRALGWCIVTGTDGDERPYRYSGLLMKYGMVNAGDFCPERPAEAILTRIEELEAEVRELRASIPTCEGWECFDWEEE